MSSVREWDYKAWYKCIVDEAGACSFGVAGGEKGWCNYIVGASALLTFDTTFFLQGRSAFFQALSTELGDMILKNAHSR